MFKTSFSVDLVREESSGDDIASNAGIISHHPIFDSHLKSSNMNMKSSLISYLGIVAITDAIRHATDPIAVNESIIPKYSGSVVYRKSEMSAKQLKARKRAKHNKKCKH